MAIVTFETVAQAAEALQQGGSRPSVRALIAALGGGSPNSVLKHLREWQAGRPLVKPSDAEIDDAILAAIRKQIDRSAQAGAAVAEARAADAEDNLQLYVDAQSAAEQQIAALTVELDQVREQVLGLTEQLTDAQRDAENERQHAIETAAALRSELADERERTNQAGAALAKAEVRLEQLPALLGEVAALKVSLGEQQAARTVAEQQAAVLTAQLDSLRGQLAELRDARARIESERDQAREVGYRAEGEARERGRQIEQQAAEIQTLRADLAKAAAEGERLNSVLVLTLAQIDAKAAQVEAGPPAAAPEFTLEPSPIIEPETTAPTQKKAPAKRRTPPPPLA
jgi:colicin import membrane protein